MAAIPETKSPVAAMIEAHYSSLIQGTDDATLRCSKIGESCDRSLWYSFRWATPIVPHEGRVERLFRTGHREEARMVADLRSIGLKVADVDPATGEQWRVKFLNGVLTGSADGIVEGVPGADKTPHLLECKTHNEKSFNDFRKKGVEVSKPVHFAQMQIYMHGLGLSRALYVAHNKNTDEVETERVKADPLVAAKILAKAERIAFSDFAPERFESFACKWCKHLSACQSDAFSRANCRTCLHSELRRDGAWCCTFHNCELTFNDQQRGCKSHLFLPSLVPGEQVDADPDANTVTYQLMNGTSYVDGRDFKGGRNV